MMPHTALLPLILLPSALAFPAFWRDDATREVRRTEVQDEVEPREPDFFLDNDPNGLDANEIYDSIMDNPEMERSERKFFEPVPMVNVFHSRHNPTEIGFSNFPTTTPRPLAPQPRPAFRGVTVAPKPVHIQRNRGPTFNCRVLNPELDGKASVRNDWSCKMLFPGIPKDNTCKCLYEVESRDSHGCATGYVYTCSRVN